MTAQQFGQGIDRAIEEFRRLGGAVTGKAAAAGNRKASTSRKSTPAGAIN